MKALIAVLAGVICWAGCGAGGGSGSYSVSGAIARQGSALSGVTVTLSSAATGKALAAAATDASGAYIFRVADTGNYSAYPSKSGYSFTPAALPIGVSGDSGGNNFIATIAPAPSTAPLAKTGQTDTNLAGDDGALQKGIAWPAPRFTDSGHGTVTDNLTGLVWLTNANCFGPKAWSDAVASARTLANGACGLTDNSQAGDWRLPNVNELSSLVSLAVLTPALPSNPFLGVQTTDYWSSTTSAALPDEAWVLYTILGNTSPAGKVNLMNVWPVRTGAAGAVKVPRTGQTIAYTFGDDGNLQAGSAWPAPRFIDNGDGTVTSSPPWFGSRTPTAPTPTLSRELPERCTTARCSGTTPFPGSTTFAPDSADSPMPRRPAIGGCPTATNRPACSTAPRTALACPPAIPSPPLN